MLFTTLLSSVALLATLAMALPHPAPSPTQPSLTQEVTEELTDTLNYGISVGNGVAKLFARDDTTDILPDFLDDITKPFDPVFLVEVQLPPPEDIAKHLPVMTARKRLENNPTHLIDEPTVPIVEFPNQPVLPLQAAKDIADATFTILPVLTARKPLPDNLSGFLDDITKPLDPVFLADYLPDPPLDEAGKVLNDITKHLPVMTARERVEDISTDPIDNGVEMVEAQEQEIEDAVDNVLEEAETIVTSPFQGLFPKGGFGNDDGKARL
ncbi:hypothetical protein LTR10_000479 [Elasticomyces elasticus]|nr:hypothetical protein LTR10_000479 [Elasticomyces elasticus]KAK4980272.1 hypothetical protein LTR42_000579 [Elasticomyces elasticus]